MARRRPARDKEQEYKELEQQDYQDELEEQEDKKGGRDSGVSRHRSKGQDKRSSQE